MAEIIPPHMWATAQVTAEQAAPAYVAALHESGDLSANYRQARSEFENGAWTGAGGDAAGEAYLRHAVRHDNHGETREKLGGLHKQTANFGYELNSALRNIEYDAEQQIAAAPESAQAAIIAAAQALAVTAHAGAVEMLGLRHGQAVAALGVPVSVLGAGLPVNVPLDTPIPPSPDPRDSWGPVSAPGPGNGQVPVSGNGPTTASNPPTAPAPGMGAPADSHQQPAVAADGGGDGAGGDDAGGDQPPGGPNAIQGMATMLPSMLTGMLGGVIGAATAIPKALASSAQGLAGEATQAVSGLTSSLGEGLADNPEHAGLDDQIPAAAGVGIGGGGGGAGAPRGGEPGPLKPGKPLAGMGTPPASVPTPMSERPATPQPPVAGMGMAPMMMPPMAGMGAGAGRTIAPKPADKEVRVPQQPNSEQVKGEREPFRHTAKADDVTGKRDVVVRSRSRPTPPAP